jgi:arylsulfatase A-like enzyme
VLFIAVDDLNDWVSCFGGNPQAITPNFDRLAKMGGMAMTKAYCAATVCCPSRTAILTGKAPSTTGVYGNEHDYKTFPKAKDLVTLPAYFAKQGYHTLSSGKIFHKHGDDHGQSEYMEFFASRGSFGDVLWEEVPPPIAGVEPGGTDFTWGATKGPVEKTRDYVTCKWGADQLKKDFGGKPFFLALGISKPHLSWYVPQEFYDLYPLEKIKPVELFRDDLNDIVDAKGNPIYKPGDRFILADKADLHRQAQRAYLACISYADHCLGVVLDGLENSKHAENTIVVVWGDHGWYLGEKMQYGKTELWEEAARVPLMVKVPGVTTPNSQCAGVVNLMDLYPTLLELCNLPANPENEGRSFAALLKDPKLTWDHPTLTTIAYKEHSLTDGRYRFIWHGGRGNGALELYDHSVDPLEHKNLAADPASQDVLARLKGYLPKHDEPEKPREGKKDKGKKKE